MHMCNLHASCMLYIYKDLDHEASHHPEDDKQPCSWAQHIHIQVSENGSQQSGSPATMTCW